MSKMTLIAALATVLSCATGCNREKEYETCLLESTKNMPELMSKPLIKKSLEKFRAMCADEQKKALEEIKAKLAK